MLYWFIEKYVALCAYSDPNAQTLSRCQHGVTAPGPCAVLAGSRRVRRDSAALPRSQEARTMGWSCMPSPDITSAVQFKTQAVNNYPKPPFEPDLRLPFSPPSLETGLFPPVTTSEGVTALYQYNNVNAFPRYQTLGLYSKINFQQILRNRLEPTPEQETMLALHFINILFMATKDVGQMPSDSRAEQSNKAVTNLLTL